MALSIAYLGPAGTYTEQAAFNYAHWLMTQQPLQKPEFVAAPSITQSMYMLAEKAVTLAVVPVENSIEGSVSFTLDTLWTLEGVVIHEAFILPINHMFMAQGSDLSTIKRVYSHPQPLGQCRVWLAQQLPHVQQIPTSSTAEALKFVQEDKSCGAIASERAASLNQIPIQYRSIQDHPDNCTKFWVLRQKSKSDLSTLGLPIIKATNCAYTTLGFSLPQNVPGALLSPLQTFANRNINLSRIESRPAKTSLGDYVFFVDAEVRDQDANFIAALKELGTNTEILKIFGSYPLTTIPDTAIS